MSGELCVRALLKGREIKTKRLENGSMLIGRDPECDFRLDNTAVSRQHARIERHGEKYMIRDLGSENGTCVNGMPISVWPIRPGDTARIAKFDLVFDFGLAESKEETDLIEFVPGLDDQNTIRVEGRGTPRP